MATNTNNNAGAILRRTRITRGMRQEDLAKAAGVTQSIVSELETGTTRMSVYYAKMMAAALGVPAAQIVREMGLIDDIEADEAAELAALQSEYPTLLAMLARLRTLSDPAQERVIAAMQAGIEVEEKQAKRLQGYAPPNAT